MPRLSDLIENFIKELIVDNNGTTELQRNEIASKFNCVPSQINYVLNTRFTTERGYYIESRRGGGGCIIIKKVSINKSNYIMHIINNIGEYISQQSSYAFINNIYDNGLINKREVNLIKAAISDKALPLVSKDRDYCRAKIIKNMLITLVNNI